MLFVELNSLNQSLEASLGDGHVLEATGHRTVLLELKLPRGVTKQWKLRDVLFVPKLAHNLLSVSKNGCHIVDAKKRLIAAGTRKTVLLPAHRIFYSQNKQGNREVIAFASKKRPPAHHEVA